tara:strand:- start:892 stop:2205 length:1314 start_codon:yes stop_codon:yes gene_type:complete
MPQQVVSVKVAEDLGEYPRLLSFPGGVPAGHEMELIVGQKGSGRKRKQVIVSDLQGLSFHGSNFSNNGGSSSSSSKSMDSCKFAIGKLDSKSGEMTLYSVDHAFVMRPQLHKLTSEPATLADMSNNLRRKTLIEEFGSRKKKRAMQQAESNAILDENVTGASAVELSISSTLQEMENPGLIDAAEEALETNRKLILPPYNDKTEDREKAFPLSGLLFNKETLETYYDAILLDDVDDMKSKKAIPLLSEAIQASFKSSKFVGESILSTVCQIELRALEKLNDADTKKDAMPYFKNCAMIAIYQHFLLNFYMTMTSGDHREIAADDMMTALSTPEVIAKYFCYTFAAASRKAGVKTLSTNKHLQSKIFSYIIALGLHASEYSFDITSLAADLKIPDKILISVGKGMGCKITKPDGGSYLLQLALPLKFPGKPRIQQKKK